MSTIFISYASSAHEWAHKLSQELLSKWYDLSAYNLWLDKSNIRPSEDWGTQIHTAISGMNLIIDAAWEKQLQTKFQFATHIVDEYTRKYLHSEMLPIKELNTKLFKGQVKFLTQVDQLTDEFTKRLFDKYNGYEIWEDRTLVQNWLQYANQRFVILTKHWFRYASRCIENFELQHIGGLVQNKKILIKIIRIKVQGELALALAKSKHMAEFTMQLVSDVIHNMTGTAKRVLSSVQSPTVIPVVEAY